MRRLFALSIVAVVVLLPAARVLAGGGSAPPPPGFVLSNNPTISATILLDPHNQGVTPTAGQGFIWVRSNSVAADMQFQIQNNILGGTFPLTFGCDVTLTTSRFICSSNNCHPLSAWMPTYQLMALFESFGITISPTFVNSVFQPLPNPQFPIMVPVITHVSNTSQVGNISYPGQCLVNSTFTADPSGGTPTDSSGAGWLLMNATIQFYVPTK